MWNEDRLIKCKKQAEKRDGGGWDMLEGVRKRKRMGQEVLPTWLFILTAWLTSVFSEEHTTNKDAVLKLNPGL